MSPYQNYDVDLVIRVIAQDTAEAMLVGQALEPLSGGARLADGGVATVVAAKTVGARPAGTARERIPKNALWIDSEDVRTFAHESPELTTHDLNVLRDTPDEVIHHLLAEHFGDDFWEAMHQTYSEVIHQIVDP